MTADENPYPVSGTMELEQIEGGIRMKPSVPCEIEWLENHEQGDLLEEIKREALQFRNPPITISFTVEADGSYEIESVEAESIDGERHTEVTIQDDGIGVSLYETTDEEVALVDETWFTDEEIEERRISGDTRVVLSD